MTRTRMDVWNRTNAEGDWPAVLLAYEVGVGKMRDLDPPSGKPVDPLGWRFQAAIHGLADSMGDPDTSNDLWCNCQHGSWFFLPWHRMYLAAFERIVQFPWRTTSGRCRTGTPSTRTIPARPSCRRRSWT